MFHLPIHTIPGQKMNKDFVCESTRKYRDYTYSILKYQTQIANNIFGDPLPIDPIQENAGYTLTYEDESSSVNPRLPTLVPRVGVLAVLTNENHSKIFAYMAPRQTAVCSFENSSSDEESTADSFSDETMCGDRFYTDTESFNSEAKNERRNCPNPDVSSLPIVEVKESIEGSMITFFWNDDTQEWNICSRNGVGCDYSYERPLSQTDERPNTFRKMVVDVFESIAQIKKMEDYDYHSDYPLDDLCDVASLNHLSKTHCYTCILQHPHNHIVYSFSNEPTLHLIAIYELNSMPPLIPIDSEDFVDACVRELANPTRKQDYLLESKTDEDDAIWEAAFRVFGESSISNEDLDYSGSMCERRNRMILQGNDRREFHRRMQAFKTNVLERYIDSEDEQIDSADLLVGSESKYFPPAWIMTNTATGHSCEVQNPFYEKAKKLRSFQPNIRFQYLYLRKNGLVEQYLHTFPRYEETIQTLETEYDYFITEVYGAYVKFYIMNIRDGSIPKNRFIHAARIHHNVYRAQPHIPRQKITRQDVEWYFAALEPSKMFYYWTNA